MAKLKRDEDPLKPNHNFSVARSMEETGAQAFARQLLEPQLRHAASASSYAEKVLGTGVDGPGIMDFVDHITAAASKAEAGDLSVASRMLASQAITLDAMFTELARRAALNMGDYVNAAEKYGRLALKAQSNCRATLEALAKLHQPREQTVRHVHVNEGGQAIVADHFHQHRGGSKSAKSDDQCHATGSAGGGSAMLGADAQGHGVPIASGEGAEAVPHARGHESGCA